MSSLIMQNTLIPNCKLANYGCSFYKRSKELMPRSCTFRCNAGTLQTPTDHVQRRSGNFGPRNWDFESIQSLSSDYKENRYSKRASVLMVQVEMLLDDHKNMGLVPQLELISDLNRLGICYHFKNKINQILNSIYSEYLKINYETAGDQESDLYSTALGFRVLRQHGFEVSQEIFDNFKNEEGNFKASLAHDTMGLLQLYEASFLLTEGEDSLELAREFSTKSLEKKLGDDQDQLDEHVSSLVRRSLELPIHWMVQRPNVRWFIEAYERRPDMNPNVLEFAKLDFNIVQAAYQQDLKLVTRWWDETCLAKKLPFARDRVVESYYWTLIGCLFEPQYGNERIVLAKVIQFVTSFDDIFDVYSTQEEQVKFNDVMQRWDIEAIDQLPDYMQICFLALNNFINELAYHVLKERGVHIIPHLRKSWVDLCKAGSREAKWYFAGYTPTLEEYIENAWVSISAPAVLFHAFFLITNPIEKKAVESLNKYHNVLKYSGIFLRLANDLGTSPHEMERGDVPKSVECFMNESGGSREEAREHIKSIIRDTHKKMNAEMVATDSGFSQEFKRIAVDLGKMAQHVYQHGDGFGVVHPEFKERISNMLFQPIDV